jgi:redox-sensitive bicupin YhaK (pirin superfamily)
MADSPVLETVSLGAQWPTVDPFLFCAHHRDDYPQANDRMGPHESLSGRELGMDFAGLDGWNMYHGTVVPGFPQHPHRGFETVSYVRTGLIDHADSMGAHARFGGGDVQWMTAGKGVVHSEMFPLLERMDDNPLEMFQVWLNLPAEDKMVDPYFTMLWDHDIPKIRKVDESGREALVTVISGALAEAVPPGAPPNSWAARDDADIAIWHIHLDARASWAMPAAKGADTRRTLYVFEGSGLDIDGTKIGGSTGAVVRADADVNLTAGSSDIECLMLQGRPIGEPVAQQGPFVMNTNQEIQQAFIDYRNTEFGGWPWDTDDPTHGWDRGRFAKHSDGRLEEV